MKAWAKYDPASGASLPLVDHGADVGAVFLALATQPIWAARLALTAGREVGPQSLERLAALAFLHDLGKANVGFWRRRSADARPVGHTGETSALFYAPGLKDRPTSLRLRKLVEDWGCFELFLAVMAHHGRPLEAYATPDQSGRADPDIALTSAKYWKSDDRYDPLAELDEFLSEVEARYPLAFASGPTLPDKSPFVALVGGLVTLADWLGSDARQFPVAGPHLANRNGLRAVSAPQAVTERGLNGSETPSIEFASCFGFAPRGPQTISSRTDLGPIVLIEAETGAGKTEAALWRWLALRRAGQVDGLYFALPTRAAAVQLHGRVQAMLERTFGGTLRAVLAVPGYLRAGDEDGQALPDFNVVWPDDGQNDARWAAERPKRYLAARVAVGTIDQALLAGLQVKHAHFRAAVLSRSLLVVDEVHASDAYMGEVLRAVLRNHVALGGHALLLSATLASEARSRLLDPVGESAPSSLTASIEEPYPAIWGLGGATAIPGVEANAKSVELVTTAKLDDPGAIANLAVEAARGGATVLVVRNSVAGALAVAKAVEEIDADLAFRAGGVSTVHHGRFAPGDRRLLDAAVETALGKTRASAGRIVVGTQTLEQSLDIDADLLVTDLAPMDVLLQRLGRLHRHPRNDRRAFSAARALVLTPAERDLSQYLGRHRDRHGLGPLNDGGGVYPDLLVIEATLRLIETNRHVNLPADNRRLVEGALHPGVLESLQEELGKEWMIHAAQQSGMRIADRGVAKSHALDVGARFSSLVFPARGEAVSTRLGGRDRFVMFDPAPTGPFGLPLSRLSIPDWMCPGMSGDVEPVIVVASPERIVFSLGNQMFRYDRWGLDHE